MKYKFQKGMALLVVLLFITTLSALVSISQSWQFDALRRTASIKVQQKNKYSLLSAETLFIANYNQYLSAEVSNPKAIWMKRPVPFSIDKTRFYVHARDLQTCFNLNALFDKKNDSGEKQVNTKEMLRQLLIQTGSNALQADISIKNLIRYVESSGYLLIDSSEASKILDLSGYQNKLLQPLLCALPVTELKINVNGLMPEHSLLMSALMSRDIQYSDMQEFIYARPAAGWISVEALKETTFPVIIKQGITSIEQHLSTGSKFYQIDIKEEQNHDFTLRTWISVDVRDIHVLGREYIPTLQ